MFLREKQLVAFMAVNVALAAATFGLSWLPVVTRLVDRPVTTSMFRFWLPVALAVAAAVALVVASRIPRERRRPFLIRHFGMYAVVPLVYVLLRIHPGILRTELGVLYLWTAAYFALNVSLAIWRAVGAWSDRVTGLAVAGTALAVYLFVTPYYQASMTANADEPHYLLVAQSLLLDGDLDLRNNYDERQYRPYHPRPLPDRHVINVGDAQYPIRDIGLPVLTLLPFAIAGRMGVLVLQSFLAAVLVWQIFHLLRDMNIARMPAWLAVTIGALTHPLLTYTTQIYPDIAATLIVVLAIRLLSSHGALGPSRLALVSASIGVLPWLTVRTWPAVVGIGAVVLWVALRGSASKRASARARVIRLAAAVLPGASLVFGLMGYHLAIFGVPLPNAGYLLIREQQQVAGNVLSGLAGMFFGRTYGLLSHAPIYLLAALGSWALFRRLRAAAPGGMALLAAGTLHLSFIAGVEHWHGDWSPPSRNVLLALPLLLAATAAGIEIAGSIRVPRALRNALIGATVIWTGAVTLLLVSFPENLYNLPEHIRRSRSSGQLWDFVAERIGFNPGLAFPSVARIDDSTFVQSLTWLAVVVCLCALGLIARRARPEVTPT